MPNTELRVDQIQWLQKVEQSLHAIDIIGRKLVTGRATYRNPGSDLILIQLEAKLIRHASRVCYLNERYRGTKYPSLNDWLTYVNLLPTEVVAVLECVRTFCVLITINDKQLLDISEKLRFTSNGRRRLRKSSYSLRSYISKWKDEGNEPIRSFGDRDLCWISFDHLTPGSTRRHPFESTLESNASDSGSGAGSYMSQSSLPTTTPPTSPSVTVINATLSNTLNVIPRNANEKSSISNRLSTTNLLTDSLTRSHSHESNLQHTINTSSGIIGLTSSHSINDCLSVSSHGAVSSPSSLRATYINQVANTVPRIPKAARAKHSIPHQWHRRKGFRISTENCHFCQRQLNFFTEYEKCKSCKWKVHSHCKEKIGDSCGLTPAYLKQALKEMFMKDTGNDGWTPSEYTNSAQQAFPFDPVDSSSSTNSSAPSTPAFPALHSTVVPTTSPFLLPSAPPSSYKNNFDFPESVPEVPDIVVESGCSDQHRLISSQGSDCTVNSYGTVVLDNPENSESTSLIDSSGSNSSSDIREEVGSLKLSPNFGCSLNRDRWSNGTIRVPNSWNDFTIPFSQIEFKKQSLIGKGRFGEVHKANWYGDVAVKLLNMSHVDEEKQLEAFKIEVAPFKNTRHDNIVLFMGYTFDLHKLGIVMYYCKGRPLHTLLHDHYEKFDFSQVVHFATQICQGVSYLHTKKIIHKDLRTKNIFVENRNRIVLTDFGLFNTKRLGQPYRSHTLIVPQYWLSYVAPELLKTLSSDLVQLSFTENSDVYAFGTIWYELMTYHFPFQDAHPDIVIWKVVCGVEICLGDVIIPQEIKKILVQCWNYLPDERPTFRDISVMLERLPKKRLARSPSFPVSRSYESVF